MVDSFAAGFRRNPLGGLLTFLVGVRDRGSYGHFHGWLLPIESVNAGLCQLASPVTSGPGAAFPKNYDAGQEQH